MGGTRHFGALGLGRAWHIKNVILLMSMHQTKGENHKVCPVLNMRHLNEHIISQSGGMPTCDKRIHEWRMMGQDCVILDLKKAYLQVFVEKDLWVHQAVRWEGKVFLLTWNSSISSSIWNECGPQNYDSYSAVHINMSKLDAIIHSVNLCVKWGVRWFTIKTDSATAHRWLKSIFEKLIV